MHDGLPFWLAYVTHVALFTTLIAAALIDSDGFRPPSRLFVPILAIGLGLPMLWPHIRRLPLDQKLSLPDWQAGLVDGLSGLSVGALLGLVAAGGWWFGSRNRQWPRSAPVLVLGTIGLVLGWQRIVEIAPASLLVVTIVSAVLRLSGVNQPVPLAAVAVILAWPRLVELDSEAHHTIHWSEQFPAAMVAGMALLTMALALVAGALSPNLTEKPSEPQPQLPAP
jgi:hypothetical protein